MRFQAAVRPGAGGRAPAVCGRAVSVHNTAGGTKDPASLRPPGEGRGGALLRGDMVKAAIQSISGGRRCGRLRRASSKPRRPFVCRWAAARRLKKCICTFLAAASRRGRRTAGLYGFMSGSFGVCAGPWHGRWKTRIPCVFTLPAVSSGRRKPHLRVRQPGAGSLD